MNGELRPDRARSEDSSDWRFAVLVLLVLLLAVIAAGLVLFIRQDAVPEGFSSLGGGVTGALIVIVGKQMTRS